MEAIFLCHPATEYAGQIWSYRQAFLDTGDSLDGCGGLEKSESPEAWIAKCSQFREEKTIPEGLVCSDLFLAVRQRDNRLVGMIDLRHHIDHPVLRVWGGHIGYSVHPQERRKGYATEMLRLCLEKCRELELDKVLVTCHDGNVGSEKAIRSNGGVYESNVLADGEDIKRFWITLAEKTQAQQEETHVCR